MQSFSPSNIKYMRQSFGERENFQGDNILAIKGSIGVDKSLVKKQDSINSPIADWRIDRRRYECFLGDWIYQIFPLCRIQFVDELFHLRSPSSSVAIEERHSKF